MGYYFIKLIPEAWKIQENTTCNGKVITYGELVAKAY